MITLTYELFTWIWFVTIVVCKLNQSLSRPECSEHLEREEAVVFTGLKLEFYKKKVLIDEHVILIEAKGQTSQKTLVYDSLTSPNNQLIVIS